MTNPNPTPNPNPNPNGLERQEEGAWAIANLSSNEAHAAHIVEAGGLQLLLTLLASPSTDVRLQAVWALANLASVPEAKPRLEPVPTLTLTLAPTLTLLTLTLALPYAPRYPKQAKQRLHELGSVPRLVESISQAARTDEGERMQATPGPSPEPLTNPNPNLSPSPSPNPNPNPNRCPSQRRNRS